MSQFTKTIVRCAIDVTSRDPFRDVFTGRNPRFWNSTDIRFELAFFKGSDESAELLDVSDFESVTLSVKPSSDRTGAAYMEKTADSSAINTGLTLAEWQAGTGQHLAIEFTYTETSLPIASGNSADFWCVVHGITSTVPPAHDTFGATTLTALEDGVPIAQGPLQGGNLIPANAVYNGSGAYVLTVTADRVYSWTDGGANDTNVVNGTETVTTSNANFTAQGTSVTLHGTAGAAVTAVVRGSLYLTADESDARYLQRTTDTRITCLDNGVTYQVVVRSVDGVPALGLEEIAGGGQSIGITCADDGITYLLKVILVDGVPVIEPVAS